MVDLQLSGEDVAMELSFLVNRQKLAQAQELDGRYALATNGDHLDADEALTPFKGQDGVEKRFRAAKGPLWCIPSSSGQTRRSKGWCS